MSTDSTLGGGGASESVGRPAPRDPIPRPSRLMRGRSEAVESLYTLIERVGPTDSHVLITGESGVGKELAVREIHAISPRSSGPLVTVNCAAIPEGLLESELFGHKRGAFTNATSDRAGRFRQAEGGTIFLDEIGEMKPDLQAKLLRVLQEKEFQPVGGSETVHGDFRVVAATNQSLEALVTANRFREDLYYRLSVFPIVIPPLRDRAEDISLLTWAFVEELNRERTTSIEGINPNVLDAMSAYHWPGNVRELRNVVERMVVLRCDGTIELADLPSRISDRSSPALAATPCLTLVEPADEIPEAGVDLNAALKAYEVRMIRGALRRTEGNRNRAARLLRINRTTLVEKIKRLGIA